MAGVAAGHVGTAALPFRQPGVAGSKAGACRVGATSSVPSNSSRSKANRLLVLDDDPFVPRWVRKIAEHEGYAVSVCDDLVTARALCRSTPPTLILLDLTLGGRDHAASMGLEALRMLAAERVTTPVILTGAVDSAVLHSASRFGMTLDLSMAGVMPKPIEPGPLRHALVAHLHRLPAESVEIAAALAAPGDALGANRLSDRVFGAAAPAPTVALSEPGDDVRLAEAFEAGELRVYYQPQVSLRTGAVAAIEALVRWQHPLRGLISPNSFLPVAERANLIRPITTFVLESALDECRGWLLAGQPVSVSVNLAASLLHDPGFPDAVEALIEKAGVPPSCVTFEVDESAAIGQVRDVLDALTHLRLKGCRLALDNFGTGFSSLVELRNLPFSQLKIDKAYVLEARSRRASRAIVEAVIEFGHRIALEIVGEGVEDRETLTLLKEAGCDLAQGFLISRPVDAVALADLLTAPMPTAAAGQTRVAGSRAH